MWTTNGFPWNMIYKWLVFHIFVCLHEGIFVSHTHICIYVFLYIYNQNFDMSLCVKLLGKPRNIFLEEHFPRQIIDCVRVRSGIFLPNVQNRFNANADFGRKLCPNYVTMRLSQWADLHPQSFPADGNHVEVLSGESLGSGHPKIFLAGRDLA